MTRPRKSVKSSESKTGSNFCCITGDDSESSDDLTARDPVNSAVRPFLVPPSQETTQSSLPSPLTSLTDLYDLERIFATGELSELDAYRKLAQCPNLDQPAKIQGRYSPQNLRSRLSKKISGTFTFTNKSSKETLRQTESPDRFKAGKLENVVHNNLARPDGSTGKDSQRPKYDPDAQMLMDTSGVGFSPLDASPQPTLSSNQGSSTKPEVGRLLDTISDSSTHLESITNLSIIDEGSLSRWSTQPSLSSAANSNLPPTESEDVINIVRSEACVELPVLPDIQAVSPVVLSLHSSEADPPEKQSESYPVIVKPENIDGQHNGNAIWPDNPTESKTTSGESADYPESLSSDFAAVSLLLSKRRADSSASNDVERTAVSPKPSVHLHEMRISQHLRSISNLSTMSWTSAPKPSVSEPKVLGRVKFGPPVSKALVKSVGSSTTSINASLPLEKAIKGCRSFVQLRTGKEGVISPFSVTDNRSFASEPEVLASLSQIHSNPETKSASLLIPDSAIRRKSRLAFNEEPGQRRNNAYDGPSDRCSLSLSRRPSRYSVSSNHEEAAILWERALRDHQDSLQGPKKRGLSFSSASRVSPSIFGKSSVGSVGSELDPLDLSARKVRSMSQLPEFKPIATQHTFDRLLVPLRSSVNERQSPNITITDTSVSDSDVVPVSNSISSATEGSACRFSLDQLPIPANAKTVALQVSSSNADEDKRISPFTKARPRSASSLEAWSRYPSHTRDERNGSAGLADSVIPRDFAPLFTMVDDDDDYDDDDYHSLKTSARKKAKAKWRMKAKSMTFKLKLLNGIPAILKPHNSAWRKSFYGRRSSMATGGTLEYPELELLPPIGARIPMAPLIQPSPSPTFSGKMTSRSSIDPSSTHGEELLSTQSGIGSEDFDSSRDFSWRQQEIDGNYLSAKGWSQVYTELLPIRTSSDEISAEPLSSFTRPQSPSARSLPTKLRTPSFRRRSSARSASAASMRRPTVDLYSTLEETEGIERARALKSADAWD